MERDEFGLVLFELGFFVPPQEAAANWTACDVVPMLFPAGWRSLWVLILFALFYAVVSYWAIYEWASAVSIAVDSRRHISVFDGERVERVASLWSTDWSVFCFLPLNAGHLEWNWASSGSRRSVVGVRELYSSGSEIWKRCGKFKGSGESGSAGVLVRGRGMEWAS